MALREIRRDGDVILRKAARPVKEVDAKIVGLLDDMIETMQSAEGLGLAAPQVGILKRIIVIEVEEQLYELINPEIVSQSGEQRRTEGCLSVPNTRGYVTRPKKVSVRAMNREGGEFNLEAEDVLAIALCHEIDHLDGKMFTDFVTQYVDPESDE